MSAAWRILAGNALARGDAPPARFTEAAFIRMIRLATDFTHGVRATIAEFDLPWSITQIGAWPSTGSPPGAHPSEASAAAADDEPTPPPLVHVQPGYLMTPFHNMALMRPTLRTDADCHARSSDRWSGPCAVPRPSRRHASQSGQLRQAALRVKTSPSCAAGRSGRSGGYCQRRAGLRRVQSCGRRVEIFLRAAPRAGIGA